MNIREAKEEIQKTVRAYTAKTESGTYRIPIARQRPVLGVRHGVRVLHVRGADLLDGTPIYDIKPYLSFTDSHPDARGGFADEKKDDMLHVECDDALLEPFSDDDRQALLELLSEDPRPSYQEDPLRIYGMEYAGFEVQFQVSDQERALYVLRIMRITEKT